MVIVFLLEDYAQNYSGKAAMRNMRSLIEHFHLPITIEEGLKTIRSKEKVYFEKGVDLKKGAKELLMYLKENNYKIVLATSSTNERAMTVLKQHQIDGYFDEMVFGTEVKKGKPNPDIFLKACEKIGVEVKQALVLEDSEAGIKAAFLANIDVICIPDMKKPNENYQAMTKALFSSLLDVISYLQSNS